MPQTFNCPNCGGAVIYNGKDVTAHCQYCHNTVPIPSDVRQASWRWQEIENARRTKKYLAIFFAIVIIIPMCIGLSIIIEMSAPLLPFLFK